MKKHPRDLPYPSAGGEYRTDGASLVRGAPAKDTPPADKPEPKTSGKSRKEQ